jgi:hypothetical protein
VTIADTNSSCPRYLGKQGDAYRYFPALMQTVL